MKVQLLCGDYNSFAKLINILADSNAIATKALEKNENLIQVPDSCLVCIKPSEVEELIQRCGIKVSFFFVQHSESPYIATPIGKIGKCQLASEYFTGNGGFYNTEIVSESFSELHTLLSDLKPIKTHKQIDLQSNDIQFGTNTIDPRVDSLLDLYDGICKVKQEVEESVHETYIYLQDLLSVISNFLKNGSRQHYEALYQILKPQQ